MVIATALVIAISVSATLAYLTDTTKGRDNVFIGDTNDVKGHIYEPNFDSTTTYYYSPGQTTNKDPEVVNDSQDDAIFTAIKLTFWIRTSVLLR